MKSLGIAILIMILPGVTLCMAAGQKPAPVISSVTFSAPSPVKAGDIITVDIGGTPAMRAAFAVKGLISMTHLKEMSAGSYHGTAVVPKGKLVRNAPLIGYLGVDGSHAAPVQASRLITSITSTIPPKLPAIKPEVHVKPIEPVKSPPPAPKPEPIVKTTPPPTPEAEKVKIVSPANGATIKQAILVDGTADPGATVKVLVTYTNEKTGMLKLSGEVASQELAVGKNGKYRLGPIALNGPLATSGLRFTIKAYYPDRADHGTAEVVVRRL